MSCVGHEEDREGRTNTSAVQEEGDDNQVKSPRRASSDTGLEHVQVESAREDHQDESCREGEQVHEQNEEFTEGPIEEDG